MNKMNTEIEYLIIDDEYYYIDFYKLIGIVLEKSPDEVDINTSISQVYAPLEEGYNNLTLASKEFTETRGNLNEAMNNIRYDLLRIFINNLIISPQEVSMMDGYKSLSNMNISQKLAFNTLLNLEIIKKVETE